MVLKLKYHFKHMKNLMLSAICITLNVLIIFFFSNNSIFFKINKNILLKLFLLFISIYIFDRLNFYNVKGVNISFSLFALFIMFHFMYSIMIKTAPERTSVFVNKLRIYFVKILLPISIILVTLFQLKLIYQV